MFVLFVFAFGIRFMFINKGPFHYDTLELALKSQKTLETFILQYQHGAGYPLTVLFGSFFIFIFKIFGVTDPVFCVNFMSVVCGALGVLFLFFFVEKLLDGSLSPAAQTAADGRTPFHAAIFSAVLFACFPPHVAISTFGKSFALSICLSLVSAFYMLRYIQEGKGLYFLFSAFFLGFCGAVRLPDVLAIVPILFLLMASKMPLLFRIRRSALFSLIALGTTSLYYIPMFMDQGLSQFIYVLSVKEQAKFCGPLSWISKYSFGWLIEIFGRPGILLTLAGLGLLMIDRRRREYRFLLLWFLTFQLYYGNISCANPRYLVIAWMPLVVAQGYFLGRFRGRIFYLAFLAVLVMALANLARYGPVLSFRHERALQVEFAQWVARMTPPDAVLIALDESEFLSYYGRRTVVQRPIGSDKKAINAFFDDVLDKMLEEGRPVYLVSSAWAYDDDGVFKKTLLKRYDVLVLGRRMNEDWHHALLNQVLLFEWLNRVEPKRERER